MVGADALLISSSRRAKTLCVAPIVGRCRRVDGTEGSQSFGGGGRGLHLLACSIKVLVAFCCLGN